MNTGNLRVLVLDQTPDMKTMLQRFEGTVLEATSPLAAGAILAQTSIDAVVLQGAVRWQVDFCQSLAPESRPAMLMLSARPQSALMADEWLLPHTRDVEFVARLQLALQRARHRRQIARRASQDFLTGLPNRRSFVRGLVREAARASRSGTGLSLLLIDLDNFKAVNEQSGHMAGDRLLRQVGQALLRNTRESELVGRIGGDEFALVIPGDEALARHAATRLQETLAHIHVSASIAVCEKLPHEDLRQLYRRCDKLLMAMKAERHALPRAPREAPEGAPWTQ